MSNINYKYYKKIYEELFKNDLGFRLKIIGNLHFRDYGNDSLYSEGYIYVLFLYFYGDVIARAGVDDYEISNPFTFLNEPRGVLDHPFNVKNIYQYCLKVEAYEFFEHQMPQEKKGFFINDTKLSWHFYNQPSKGYLKTEDIEKINQFDDTLERSSDLPLNSFRVIKGVVKHNFTFSFTYTQMFELYMITRVDESGVGIDINILMDLYINSRLDDDNCHDDFVKTLVYIGIASMYEYRKHFIDLYLKFDYSDDIKLSD
jgi:hypothetical protein